MKSGWYSFPVLVVLLLATTHVSAQAFERADNQELVSTISGALLYLEDSQLRLRKAFRKKKKTTRQKDAGKTMYFYLTHYTPDCYYKLHGDAKTAIWESYIQFIPQNLRIGKRRLLLFPTIICTSQNR